MRRYCFGFHPAPPALYPRLRTSSEREAWFQRILAHPPSSSDLLPGTITTTTKISRQALNQRVNNWLSNIPKSKTILTTSDNSTSYQLNDWKGSIDVLPPTRKLTIRIPSRSQQSSDGYSDKALGSRQHRRRSERLASLFSKSNHH